MDPLSDNIQHLPESKRTKYIKFMVNIIAHLSALSRIIEKEIDCIRMIFLNMTWNLMLK